jgi:hypothetical protein
MFYDDLVSSRRVRSAIALPEIEYLDLVDDWQKGLHKNLLEVGKEAFVERSLDSRLFGFAMGLLVRAQIDYLGWSGRLAAIQPHTDSRPILTSMVSKPFNWLMAKAARDITL